MANSESRDLFECQVNGAISLHRLTVGCKSGCSQSQRCFTRDEVIEANLDVLKAGFRPAAEGKVNADQ